MEAVPPPGPWQQATVERIWDETAHAKSFRLLLERPMGHLAGQHLVVRLRAPDGYTASRSYSIASAPEADGEVSQRVDITVELLAGGEVSGFLHGVVVPGDRLEVRGPIGGFFVWRGDRPALLVAGGSGVVPLMSMLRLARRSGRRDLVCLVVSVRSPADLYYREELPGPETSVVFTREAEPGAARPPGHLLACDLERPAGGREVAYVCGSSGFADHVTGLLGAVGFPTAAIRVERFGPSG